MQPAAGGERWWPQRSLPTPPYCPKSCLSRSFLLGLTQGEGPYQLRPRRPLVFISPKAGRPATHRRLAPLPTVPISRDGEQREAGARVGEPLGGWEPGLRSLERKGGVSGRRPRVLFDLRAGGVGGTLPHRGRSCRPAIVLGLVLGPQTQISGQEKRESEQDNHRRQVRGPQTLPHGLWRVPEQVSNASEAGRFPSDDTGQGAQSAPPSCRARAGSEFPWGV